MDQFTITKAGASEMARRRVGISAAALLLGGGAALGLIPRAGQSPRPAVIPAGTSAAVPPNASVAATIRDDMTFKEAFAAARNEVGPGGVFVWHGQPYNTFWQEEWADLSLAQRQEYAEQVLGNEIPVRHGVAVQSIDNYQFADGDAKPTVVEGYVDGRRVMGLDDDNDGLIDALVIEGDDAIYRVVDRTGDNGLDTLYQYDPVADDYRMLHALATPTLLSTDRLNDELETAMSRQIVNDILADETDSMTMLTPDQLRADEPADELPDDDDTYMDNADVHELDDPHAAHGTD